MHSCSALGVGGGGAVSWEHMPPIQKEAKMVAAQYYYIFVVRDVGQVTVLSPIAWKRRLNQQEIHQLSINTTVSDRV